MASNDREERRRMRQRGAGAQPLSNANFQFTIPLPPQRSARRTPQPLPKQPSSRRTPQPRQLGSAARITSAGSGAKRSAKASKGQRSASVSSSVSTGAGKPKQTKTPSAKSPPLFVTPTVVGKRKRGEVGPRPPEKISKEDELQTEDEQYQASSSQKKPAARPKQSAATGGGKWSPEDEDLPDELSFQDEELQASMEKNRQERMSKSASATPAPRGVGVQDGPSRQNAPVAVMVASNSARKKQMPIRSSGKALAPIVQTPVQRPAPRKSLPKSAASTNHAQSTLEDEEEEDSEDEISPSKLDQESAGTSAETPMNFIADDAEDDGFEDQDDRGIEDEEQNEDESMDELSPDFGRKKPRPGKQRSETETPAPRTNIRPDIIEDEAEEEEGEESIRPKKHQAVVATAQPSHRQPSTASPRSTAAGPIPVRRPKAKTTATKSKGPRQKRSKSDQKRVTIQVYRVYHPDKQLREVNSDDEEDRMQAATRIPGVNGPDVLAQIVEEKLDSRIQNLHEKALDVPDTNPGLRAELKRKLGAVQNFNAALQDRLLELRSAVDTGSALRNRVKDAVKDKIKLRADFLEIRKQREDLNQKMDEVRAAHAERMRRMKEMNEVNIAMSDIEMAIQRGREHAKREGREDEGPDVPIDMLLETVAVDVQSNGGGLFDRIKGFNGRLERAAMVLEGRG